VSAQIELSKPAPQMVRQQLVKLHSQNTSSISQLAVTLHQRGGGAFCFASRLPLFELARMLVRFDHIACSIVNADHSIM
jgi:hypothetical protein